MVEALNKEVDLVMDGTSYMGLTDYGKIIIGKQGFEFYNDRDVRKFVQIPWEEVDLVIASVLLGGRWIPRYAIQTKRNGTFTFSSKHPKEVLRAMRKYVDSKQMVRSLSFLQVLSRGIKRKFKK